MGKHAEQTEGLHALAYLIEIGDDGWHSLDTAVQMECMARGLMGKRLRYRDLVA